MIAALVESSTTSFAPEFPSLWRHPRDVFALCFQILFRRIFGRMDALQSSSKYHISAQSLFFYLEDSNLTNSVKYWLPTAKVLALHPVKYRIQIARNIRSYAWWTLTFNWLCEAQPKSGIWPWPLWFSTWLGNSRHLSYRSIFWVMLNSTLMLTQRRQHPNHPLTWHTHHSSCSLSN